jgi:hypothetical protein
MIECLHRPRYKLAWISHNFPTHKHVFLERSPNPHSLEVCSLSHRIHRHAFRLHCCVIAQIHCYVCFHCYANTVVSIVIRPVTLLWNPSMSQYVRLLHPRQQTTYTSLCRLRLESMCTTQAQCRVRHTMGTLNSTVITEAVLQHRIEISNFVCCELLGIWNQRYWEL